MPHRLLMQCCCWSLLLQVAVASVCAADIPGTTVKLPHAYSRFTLAGGGRFVAFHFDLENRVGLLDILTGEVSFEIDGVPPASLLAGNSTKLIVVSPDKMMLRRWDLQTEKRDGISLLQEETPREALM